MSLADNLLAPIPGDNPSGANLRYDPVYDKIKEARREEDDAPQGDWRREVKKADYPLVIRLASEALAKKTKDLQLAAWLTEAQLRHNGAAGLAEGLDLLRALVADFWDTLHPVLEDGDSELRVAPLDWVGSSLEAPLKKAPLTKPGKWDWFKYKESRAVGYEADASASEEKQKAREAAIAEKRLTAEEFDEAFANTDRAFYEQQKQHLEHCLSSLESLKETCDEKFGRDGPGFGKLQAALEEVRLAVRVLLEKKGGVEPAASESVEEEITGESTGSSSVAASPATPKRKSLGEPADREDAYRRIVDVARYLRQQDSASPVPYVILRGWRWGELRGNGSGIDPAQLEAPSSDVRQQLKRLGLNSQWQEALELAETAMSEPCGRAWLDLQRYAVKACEELGGSYDGVAGAIRSELRSLLADFPQLPQLTLTDDTPTANPETLAWIREKVSPPQAEAQTFAPPAVTAEEKSSESEVGIPSAHELAMEAFRGGRVGEAIEILSREVAQEQSGRARFNRKIELARICMASGHEAIAYPILVELADEVERRKLEEWELHQLLAQPLTLLYKCLQSLGRGAEEKEKVYARICQLDPRQALECSR